MPLTETNLMTWIALRRVRRGGVAKTGDCHLDYGRPVPAYLSQTLDLLARARLVTLADADPNAGGLRRMAVTEEGRIQYLALCIRAAGSTR